MAERKEAQNALSNMFPAIDSEIVKIVLSECGDNMDVVVDHLLSMHNSDEQLAVALSLDLEKPIKNAMVAAARQTTNVLEQIEKEQKTGRRRSKSVLERVVQYMKRAQPVTLSDIATTHVSSPLQLAPQGGEGSGSRYKQLSEPLLR